MRTFLKILVGLLVTGGVATGAAYGVKAHNQSTVVAEVCAVSTLSYYYWGDTMESYGYITSDSAQNVYTDSSQQISEVYVEEGQEVQVGDPLLAYDMTENEIKIEQKKLEIAKTQNTIEQANQQLAKLSTDGTDKKQAADGQVTSITEIEKSIKETNTELYRWQHEKSYEEAKKEFDKEQRERAAQGLDASGDASGDADESELWEYMMQEDIDDMVKMYSEMLVSLQDELWWAKFNLTSSVEDKRQEIKELDIELRQKQRELEQMQSLSEDGIVYATVSGTVKNMQDADHPASDGSAFLTVSASDGLYVKGQISELYLDQIEPGMMVEGSTWNSGTYFTAVIESVDPEPLSSSYYGSDGSAASYYYYTAYIEDATGMTNGEDAQLTFTVNSEEATDTIYLEKMYLRKENGQTYVYKAGEDGTLVKQYVTTGKTIYGSAVEITSGLTAEDYIAFPYGKTAKEGVATKIVDYIG